MFYLWIKRIEVSTKYVWWEGSMIIYLVPIRHSSCITPIFKTNRSLIGLAIDPNCLRSTFTGTDLDKPLGLSQFFLSKDHNRSLVKLTLYPNPMRSTLTYWIGSGSNSYWVVDHWGWLRAGPSLICIIRAGLGIRFVIYKTRRAGLRPFFN